MTQPIRIALAGAGAFGEKHLDGLKNIEDAEVTVVSATSQEKADAVAAQYGVSYPTVRLRLDRLIQKIQLGEQIENEPYIALIKRLAVDDKLDFDTARRLFTLVCVLYWRG